MGRLVYFKSSRRSLPGKSPYLSYTSNLNKPPKDISNQKITPPRRPPLNPKPPAQKGKTRTFRNHVPSSDVTPDLAEVSVPNKAILDAFRGFGVAMGKEVTLRGHGLRGAPVTPRGVRHEDRMPCLVQAGLSMAPECAPNVVLILGDVDIEMLVQPKEWSLSKEWLGAHKINTIELGQKQGASRAI